METVMQITTTEKLEIILNQIWSHIIRYEDGKKMNTEDDETSTEVVHQVQNVLTALYGTLGNTMESQGYEQ